LGLAEVPSESAAAVTSLLENLVDQKVTPIVVTCPSSRAPRPGGPGAVGHEWAYGCAYQEGSAKLKNRGVTRGQIRRGTASLSGKPGRDLHH